MDGWWYCLEWRITQEEMSFGGNDDYDDVMDWLFSFVTAMFNDGGGG